MIYGRKRSELDETGLLEMDEVTFATSGKGLRQVAEFLINTAIEMESAPESGMWHRHVPPKVAEHLGCDLIVVQPATKSSASDASVEE